MDEATRKHVEELVAMPFRTFLDVCVAWKEEAGEDFSCVAQTLCPVHQYAMQKGRCLAVTGHTELCPVCEKPMCPTCGSHCVDQISRVTGYMQVVSGWNSAKKTGVRRPASVQHSRRGNAVKRFFHKKSSKNCPPGGGW